MKILMSFIAALLLTTGCARTGTDNVLHDHDHDAEAGAELSKGPHGGRLLGDEHFQMEVSIFETNVPPEYRLYAYANGKPVAPTEIQAGIELQRFGSRVDTFSFTPKQDYLLGNREVEEPHSFAVTVKAEYAGKPYRWNYESYEGRTRIDADMAAATGVATRIAGPGALHETVTLYGRIQPNAERIRSISARFPGLIRSVSRTLGEHITAGETLATVESNDSLQTYAIAAPIGGVITERHANIGETTDGTPLFVITDYASVWAELSVFPHDRALLKVGQSATITATDGGATATGRITSIVASTARDQSLLVRLALDNRDGHWVPGQFVSGAVTVAEQAAAVVVPLTALQTFRDWDVVFVNDGDTYQAMPVQLGRRDGTQAEVLSGLDAGQRYVSDNSYLIKADIEKSAASHDH